MKMKSKSNPANSSSYEKAKIILPESLWPILDEFIEHYKFAALKHHGHKFVSPLALAELIIMGWRPTEKNINEK